MREQLDRLLHDRWFGSCRYLARDLLDGYDLLDGGERGE
jgi:hypothetical protein